MPFRFIYFQFFLNFNQINTRDLSLRDKIIKSTLHCSGIGTNLRNNYYSFCFKKNFYKKEKSLTDFRKENYMKTSMKNSSLLHKDNIIFFFIFVVRLFLTA